MVKANLATFLLLFSFLFIQGQSNIINHLDNQKITSIFSNYEARLYVRTTDETYLFNGANFLQTNINFINNNNYNEFIEKLLTTKDEFGLLGTVTTSASLDEKRVIFTNSTSRLYQSHQGKILRYLIPDLDEENLVINKLVSAGDYLLICTLNDGLYVWKHKEFVLDKLNYSQGLSNNNVNDAYLDDWGNLWIATDFGLKQLVYIDKSKSSVPIVSVDKINLHYDEVRRQEIKNLKEFQNSLQFHFSSRDFSGSRGISYDYRLGEQYDWKSINGNQNQISLSNLLPGNYSFELRATNGNELYGYTEPIDFSIKASTITSIWKYVLGGIAALGLLWLWSLARYNKSVKTFETERNKLKLENDLLKTEQKALQLQMNPHFVFNALNSIQGLIATNENKAARKYLNKFSTMMRSMLDQSRGEDIDLDSEIKYLDDYLSLEQMGKPDKFDFEITKSDNVPDVKIPAMLIQPFVENAIVHGMRGLDKKGMIKVNFRNDDDKLVCEIDDNGVGRASTAKQSDHKSVALQVVKERLQKYSKFKNYENLQVIDKKNEDGSSAGTKILINLPQL